MKRGRSRTGKRAEIWLAFAVALALHLGFLFLPILGENRPAPEHRPSIAIELSMVEHQAPDMAVPAPESMPREPVVEQRPETPPAESPPETTAEAPPVTPLQPTATPAPANPVFAPGLHSLGETEKKVLTSTILARQYLTEESAVDRLFGKPLAQEVRDVQKDFHYPLRPDLLEMLDKPLPDLPFEYTPGLVYFAYDPGLKGDLQRFWDVITPEFGWRTKYGTEVKCALVLVIVGCVWK